MTLSSWIAYIISGMIGLSLLGAFGDTTKYYFLYGVVLILLSVWWALRRIGMSPI